MYINNVKKLISIKYQKLKNRYENIQEFKQIKHDKNGKTKRVFERNENHNFLYTYSFDIAPIVKYPKDI